MALQLGAHGVDVEVAHGQAEVIHVASLKAGRAAAHPPQLAVDWNQVDQRRISRAARSDADHVFAVITKHSV